MAEEFENFDITKYDIEKMRENAIKSLYASLEDVDAGSNECKDVINCIQKLEEHRLEELKISNDRELSEVKIVREAEEAKKRRIVDYLKIGVSVLTFGAGAFLTARWRAQDMMYEESGMWRSSCSKTTQKIFEKSIQSKMEDPKI